MKGFLVAGTSSGVGKTTVTLALLAAIRRRGHAVQPFKGGPDFLDTGHLTRIAGRAARNVDTWMLTPEANQSVVHEASRGADAIVIEGMMGLFDGKDGLTERGSSAEIAKLFKLPVLLVLDAGKSARSIAAVVLGFELFDPGLTIAGVILNRAASERHYLMLRAAIELTCKTPVLGWLPREPSIAVPERHLGLHTAEETDHSATIEILCTLAETYLDLDRILALERADELTPAAAPIVLHDTEPLRIGVARDKAFSFYYEDNLDLLRQHGATIVPFSPLNDAGLPPDLDALYLGGGYPELHAAQLATNISILADLRAFAATERPIYAECGGMIYLSQHLTTADGAHHPLAGLLPLAFEMTGKLVSFGYVTVTLKEDCLLGTRGTILRGHSFHYSRLLDTPSLTTAYDVQYSLSGRSEDEGYRLGSILASYIHLHFRTHPGIAAHFLATLRAAKVARLVSA